MLEAVLARDHNAHVRRPRLVAPDHSRPISDRAVIAILDHEQAVLARDREKFDSHDVRRDWRFLRRHVAPQWTRKGHRPLRNGEARKMAGYGDVIIGPFRASPLLGNRGRAVRSEAKGRGVADLERDRGPRLGEGG